MTDDMIKLGKRAVACKGWRWMRGMNTTTDDTFIAFSDCDEAYWLAHPDDPCEVDPIAGMIPDLSDPATLGCLLALVREAWGCSGMSTIQNRGCWEVWKCQRCSGECFDGFGATEAEALVDALEGAP